MRDSFDRWASVLDPVPLDSEALYASLLSPMPHAVRVQRGWRDVLRCLRGRHRPVFGGPAAGHRVRRCSCGAIQLDRGKWGGGRPFILRDANGRTRRERRVLRQIERAVDEVVRRHFPE